MVDENKLLDSYVNSLERGLIMLNDAWKNRTFLKRKKGLLKIGEKVLNPYLTIKPLNLADGYRSTPEVVVDMEKAVDLSEMIESALKSYCGQNNGVRDVIRDIFAFRSILGSDGYELFAPKENTISRILYRQKDFLLVGAYLESSMNKGLASYFRKFTETFKNLKPLLSNDKMKIPNPLDKIRQIKNESDNLEEQDDISFLIANILKFRSLYKQDTINYEIHTSMKILDRKGLYNTHLENISNPLKVSEDEINHLIKWYDNKSSEEQNKGSVKKANEYRQISSLIAKQGVVFSDTDKSIMKRISSGTRNNYIKEIMDSMNNFDPWLPGQHGEALEKLLEGSAEFRNKSGVEISFERHIPIKSIYSALEYFLEETIALEKKIEIAGIKGINFESKEITKKILGDQRIKNLVDNPTIHDYAYTSRVGLSLILSDKCSSSEHVTPYLDRPVAEEPVVKEKKVVKKKVVKTKSVKLKTEPKKKGPSLGYKLKHNVLPVVSTAIKSLNRFNPRSFEARYNRTFERYIRKNGGGDMAMTHFEYLVNTKQLRI